MDNTTFIRLLEKGEGVDIEFKQEFPQQARDMAKEFGAFANTEGVVIFIGVSDNGEKIGLQEPDKLQQRLAGVARDICEPALNPEMGKIKFGDKWIIYINILRQRPPVGVEGKYYIRVGPTTRAATSQELEKLFKDAKILDARILYKVDMPRDFMYVDTEGIDDLYARFIDNSSSSSSLPCMVKLQELLYYLATKRGKDFFENLSDAIVGCSTSEEGVFVNIKQKFDAPQFLLNRDGVAEINLDKSVSFEIGFADPYDYDEKYYKKSFRDSRVIMMASLDKFPHSSHGMSNVGHDAPFFRENNGKNLQLGVFGSLLPLGEYSYQIKPYTIRRIHQHI